MVVLNLRYILTCNMNQSLHSSIFSWRTYVYVVKLKEQCDGRSCFIYMISQVVSFCKLCYVVLCTCARRLCKSSGGWENANIRVYVYVAKIFLELQNLQSLILLITMPLLFSHYSTTMSTFPSAICCCLFTMMHLRKFCASPCIY